MRAQIISDVHSRYDRVEFHPDAQIVIAAGDIAEGPEGVEWLKSSGKTVLYVPGNHEYYGADLAERDAAMARAAEGSNVHWMNLKSAQSGPWRFICAPLWSDFQGMDPALMAHCAKAMNDYRHIGVEGWMRDPENRARYLAARAELLEAAPEAAAFCPERPRLMNPLVALCLHRLSTAYLAAEIERVGAGRAVVATHHAPSAHSLLFAGYHAHADGARFRAEFPLRLKSHKIGAYASALEFLFATRRIELWTHGHLHEGLRYSLGGADVITNPTGYADSQNAAYERSMLVDLADPGRHRLTLRSTLCLSLRRQGEAVSLLRSALARPKGAKGARLEAMGEILAFARVYNQQISILLQQSPADCSRAGWMAEPLSMSRLRQLEPNAPERLPEQTRLRFLRELLSRACSNAQRCALWADSLGAATPEVALWLQGLRRSRPDPEEAGRPR